MMKNVRLMLFPSSVVGFLSSSLLTLSSAAAFTTLPAPLPSQQYQQQQQQQQEKRSTLSAPRDHPPPPSSLSSLRNWFGGPRGGGGGGSTITATRLFGTKNKNNQEEAPPPAPPTTAERQPRRIGIVGGGLAGVSVAHALATRYAAANIDGAIQITVLEGDSACRPHTERPQQDDDDDNSHAVWTAATARNANALVPGAAMHVFARPAVVWQVLRDTATEWWLEQQTAKHKWGLTAAVGDDDDFRRPPPYFALHAWHCLGPAATAAERASLGQFLRHFLSAAVAGGNADANQRGRLLHQLAAANRQAYLEAYRRRCSNDNNNHSNNHSSSSSSNDNGDDGDNDNDDNRGSCWGHSRGFVALHRTRAAAEASVREAAAHGETGVQLLEPSQVIPHVPRVAPLQQPQPQQREEEVGDGDDRPLPAAATSTAAAATTVVDYHGVRRANDHTASCELFVRHWIEEMVATGLVEYRTAARVARVAVQREPPPPPESDTGSKGDGVAPAVVYRVTTEDGATHDFDLLVLAAGPPTPLLADQLGALPYCPTYPLRGYSLTVFVDREDDGDDKSNEKSDNHLLLPQPFSLDSLYCSSVAPGMARLAGFGEFVGYPPRQQQDRNSRELVPPSVGPAVLARYARKLFPDAVIDNAAALEDAVLPCFRALSPDDLPLAGEVPGQPGLFLHTGHGTLGWTVGLATGDCVAQAVVDRLRQPAANAAWSTTATQEGTFTLPDGSTMDRWVLSPGRFVTTKEKATQTVQAAPSSTRQLSQPTSNENNQNNQQLEPKHQ